MCIMQFRLVSVSYRDSSMRWLFAHFSLFIKEIDNLKHFPVSQILTKKGSVLIFFFFSAQRIVFLCKKHFLMRSKTLSQSFYLFLRPVSLSIFLAYCPFKVSGGDKSNNFFLLTLNSFCIFGEYEGNISAIIHGNMRKILSRFGECAKNIVMYSPFTKKDINLSLSRQIFDQTTFFNHLYRQYCTGRKTLSLYFPNKSYVIILTLKEDVSASASALPSADQRKS